MKIVSSKIFIVVTVAFTTISSWLYALDYRNSDQKYRSVITRYNTARSNVVVNTIAERKSVSSGHTVNVCVALIAETVDKDYNSRSCMALDSDGWLGVKNIEILYYAGLDSLMLKISREILKYDLITGFILEEKVIWRSPVSELVYLVEYKYDNFGDIDEITIDQYDQENNLLPKDTIPGYSIHDYYDDENSITVVGTLLKYRLRAGSIKIHTNPILLGTFAENTCCHSPVVIQGNVTNLDSDGKPYSYSSTLFVTKIEADS